MKKLLLIGPPGAGKTVIANKLSEVLDIPFIKTGSLLRDLPKSNPNYNLLQEFMVKGELAPNRIVGEIVKQEVEKNPEGFILDGWLRQISDLEVYDPKIDWVIYLDCPREICKDRVLNRVVCKIHGSVYSYSEEVCHLCNGVLEKRSDDTEETFKHRWEIFENLTLPVIEVYKNQGKLLRVNASVSIPNIVEDIKKGIKHDNL
jgi:adenylate kinase